ncbi:hypothetical protein SUGI_0563270 [Cryptomeria japonica]|nr:hypothetical protein SUGI_0563270 [Cryptomeria japonica]
METLNNFRNSIAAQYGVLGKYAECVGTGAPVYMDVISEYLAAKVFLLATKNNTELSCGFGGGVTVEEQESKCSPSRIH